MMSFNDDDKHQSDRGEAATKANSGNEHTMPFIGERATERRDEVAATVAFAQSSSQPTDHGSENVKTRFRILRAHALGGLGQVSVARDEELHRDVALKEIRPEFANDLAARARFVLEAEVTGGLEHPGIVPVYGLGMYADGRPFYAMRFIQGDSLKDAVERFHRNRRPGRDTVSANRSTEGVPEEDRQLELHRLLGRFIDVCQAIEYAHSRGVLHRDLKPSNIMLGKFGETLVVDWGLAKPRGGSIEIPSFQHSGLHSTSGSSIELTQMGTVVGTLQYMSPEQARGRSDLLGPAADIFSLGATLYHLLAGRSPYHEVSRSSLLRAVQEAHFPPPRSVCHDVHPALEAITLKAMAKEPADRYLTAAALLADVEHWLADEPVACYREPISAHAWRWIRKHKSLVSLIAAVLLVSLTVAVAYGFVTSARHRAAEQEKIAGEMTRLRDSAELERTVAVEQRAEALVQREKATAQEHLARRYRYISQANMAGAAWRESQVARMQTLLQSEIPASETVEDMRGWEWWYLWRLLHKNQTTLKGHTGTVFSLAFSPDGGELATSSSDGILLWDVPKGELKGRLEGAAIGARCLAFSPNGDTLGTLAAGTLQVWDTDDRRLRFELKSLGKDFAFSPDGSRIVTLVGERKQWRYRSFDIADGNEINATTSPLVNRECFAIRPGSSWIAVYDSKAIELRNTESDENFTLTNHPAGITQVSFSPDGRKLVFGSDDHTARVWDVELRTQEIVLSGHTALVRAATFSPDGAQIVTASDDRTIRFWNAATGKEELTLRGHHSAVWNVRFHPSEPCLASVSADRNVKLWRPLSRQDYLALPADQPANSEFAAIAFHPNGRTLAHQQLEGIYLWQPSTGERTAIRPLGIGRPMLDFDSRGEQLVAGGPGSPQTVQLWNADASELRETLTFEGTSPAAVRFRPGGDEFAVVTGMDGTREKPGDVRIWNVRERRYRATFHDSPMGLFCVAFSPDGRRIAAGGYDTIVRVWDADRGEILHRFAGHTKTIYSLAFDPEGNTLASCSSDLSIRLWNLKSGEPIGVLGGHAERVLGLAFSPDGTRLASASGDSTVKVWDLQTLQETATLPFGPGRLTQVLFSPDGSRIAAVGPECGVAVWEGCPLSISNP